jgi:hypothetical protein
MDRFNKGREDMTPSIMSTYLINVRNTIFKNVNWYLEHILEEEEDQAAEKLLLAIEDYCYKLRMDPSKRIKKRRRISHGSGRTRQVDQISRKV